MRAHAIALSASVLFGTSPLLAEPQHAPNVVPLVVRTPHGGFNRLVVCESGTERCAAIDAVMVDTGSTGLRLEASAVPPWLRLPAFLGPDRSRLAECLRFVHDPAWGPLVRADVRLRGLTASALPLQVIDDGVARRRRPAHGPMSVPHPTGLWASIRTCSTVKAPASKIRQRRESSSKGPSAGRPSGDTSSRAPGCPIPSRTCQDTITGSPSTYRYRETAEPRRSWAH